MRKIAVIFPGVGYTKDRPILYYAGKLALKRGYELKFVDFSGIKWDKERLKERDFLLKILGECLHIAEETLGDAGELPDDEVVFISKSIGTVVATAYAKKRSIDVCQICFSPLESIEDYVKEESAVLFCSDEDPLADYAVLERIAKEKRLKMHRISGCNHSLETGDIEIDIDNLKSMMRCVDEILGG